jgi:6-phosphogluconolactonase (cycloisomerase 2 family)
MIVLLLTLSMLGYSQTYNRVSLDRPLAAATPVVTDSHLEYYTLATNFQGRGLNMFQVDSQTGSLTPVAGQPFAMGASLQSADSTPNGHFVYGADTVTGQLHGFRLEATTGVLSALPGFPRPSQADSIVSIDDGAHLYVVGGNTIDAFSIDETSGSLSQLSGFPMVIPGMTKAQVGRFSHTGFVFVSDPGSDQIFSFSHDEASGSLTLVGTAPVDSDPAGLQMDDTHRFLYVSHRDGTLQGFSVGADGTLTPVAQAPVVFGPPGQIAYRFTVKQRILYIGDNVGNSLNAFSVGPTGELTPVMGYPAAGVGGDTVMSFQTPLLPYIYIGRQKENQLHGFRVDASGNRTALPGLPIQGSGSPSNLESIEVTL